MGPIPDRLQIMPSEPVDKSRGAFSAVTLVVARTLEDLRVRVRGWRAAGERVALVPTMGALHEGHLDLVNRARREADRTVVSIFVNPTQFAPNEDFDAYPQTLEGDCAQLDPIGADLAYAPTARGMYPAEFATTITPGGPALAGLEDAFRPHFFGAVATVVAKLFAQCGPDIAVFGEKDYQQLQVVRRMVRDLDLPVSIVAVETAREADGLAMSSRNRFLSPAERRTAAELPRMLRTCAAALRSGEEAAAALGEGRSALERVGFTVDYVALRDALMLAPIAAVGPAPARLLAAAKLGTTRLIDNIAV